MRATAEEIEAAKTSAGGWTRETLAGWGVSWPPPPGWKKKLTSNGKTPTDEAVSIAFQIRSPAILDQIEAEVGKRMLAQSRKAHTIPVTPNAGNIVRAKRAAELREKLRPDGRDGREGASQA